MYLRHKKYAEVNMMFLSAQHMLFFRAKGMPFFRAQHTLFFRATSMPFFRAQHMFFHQPKIWFIFSKRCVFN